ncbi:hypothetical protein L1887_58488 [Cichorium endivia]|nr:hypothetical protein L1887_58488 [Cichorium endivia]
MWATLLSVGAFRDCGFSLFCQRVHATAPAAQRRLTPTDPHRSLARIYSPNGMVFGFPLNAGRHGAELCVECGGAAKRAGWVHCGGDALEVGGGSRPVDAGNGGSANSTSGSRTAIRMANSYKRASWEQKWWPMHRGLLHICRPSLRCWGTRRASTVGCFRTGRQVAVAMEHGWNNGAERTTNRGKAED